MCLHRAFWPERARCLPGTGLGVSAGSGQADGGPLQQILGRLEGLGQQLDAVAAGQKAVESVVWSIHQQLRKDLGGCVSSEPATRPSRPRPSPLAIKVDDVALKLSGAAPMSPAAATAVPRRPRTPSIGSAAAMASPSAAVEEDCMFWASNELRKLRSSPCSVTHSSIKDIWSLSWAAQRAPRLPFHPDSWVSALLASLSIALLLWDAVMIPYQLAWDVPFEGWTAIVSWSTSVFWVLDLLLRFLTGYQRDEEVVMDLRSIARRYLSTTFFLDLAIAAADITGNIAQTARRGKSLPYFKMSRFFKLPRVMRLSSVFRHGKVALAWDVLATAARQKGLYEHFVFAAKVVQSVVCITWLNHAGSCLFHVVGKDATDKLYSDTGNLEPDDADYILGFFWAASAMIAGESVVMPQTKAELATTVLCIVFGFIFSSGVISSLIATVIEFQNSNKKRDEMLQTLRQFLYQHKVDPRIAAPIVRRADVRMCSRHWLTEGDVAALSLLTPTMQSQLWYAIYGPCLLANHALCALNAVDRSLVKNVCFQALKYESCKPGSRVFEALALANGAHYVVSGSLEYVPAVLACESEREDLSPGQAVHVRKGAWISEVALWVNWLHRGYLDATTACELLTVSANAFVRTLRPLGDLHPIVKQYSAALLASLHQEPAEYLTDLNPPVTHQSVVVAMPLEERISLSQGALQAVIRDQWQGRLFSSQGLAKLREEIQEGSCDLMVDAQDHVHRVTTIVALRLCREEDGALLTQVGKIMGADRFHSCQPPGSKVKLGESPQLAVGRLARSKLQDLGGDIRIGRFTEDVQDRDSKKYGLKSRYMRTLFHATLAGDSGGNTKILSRRAPSAPEAAGPMTNQKTSWPRASTLKGSAYDPTLDYQAFVLSSDLEDTGTNTEKDTVFIYAWLMPEDFDALSRPCNEKLLKRWIAELEFDRSAMCDDCVGDDENLRRAAVSKG